MGKRQNGEGSWGKKKIHGNIYYYFRDVDGHYTYGKTQNDVKDKLAKPNKDEPKSAPYISIGKYVYDWLYNKKYSEVGLDFQQTSFDSYEGSLIQPFFKFKDFNMADKPLDKLSVELCNKYIKALAGKYSRNTIKKTWVVLKMAFDDTDFELHKFLPEINLSKVKIPSEMNVAVKKKNTSFTSQNDMEKIYNEALKKTSRNTDYYGTAAKMIVFIMYSGLRLGEACALKWENVNLDKGTIIVKTTSNKIKVRDHNGIYQNQMVFIDKSPKSLDSIREIPYRKRAEEMLLIMDKLYPNHRPQDLVFPTSSGKVYARRNVERTLERILSHAQCSSNNYTIHSLRHGYGSILYQEGVDLKTISKLLGHADVSTTANIYIDTTTETLINILKKVDA